MRPEDIYILIGCEESQAVCKAFRELGFQAFSNDIQDCSGGSDEYHLKMDFKEALGLRKWNMVIGFPPCTYLANAGLHYLKTKPERVQQHKDAVDFFKFVYDSCDTVAVENPVGWMNTNWKKPTQIIQPYYFGDPEIKTTCLWLKNLSVLNPTLLLEKPAPRGGVVRKSGKNAGKMYNYYFRQGKSAKSRSKTFPGIAAAMAKQWGDHILKHYNNEL